MMVAHRLPKVAARRRDVVVATSVIDALLPVVARTMVVANASAFVMWLPPAIVFRAISGPVGVVVRRLLLMVVSVVDARLILRVMVSRSVTVVGAPLFFERRLNAALSQRIWRPTTFALLNLLKVAAKCRLTGNLKYRAGKKLHVVDSL
jgi:hypothetical protein